MNLNKISQLLSVENSIKILTEEKNQVINDNKESILKKETENSELNVKISEHLKSLQSVKDQLVIKDREIENLKQ